LDPRLTKYLFKMGKYDHAILGFQRHAQIRARQRTKSAKD